MTDRELLELAAKAAGYEGGEYCETSGCEPAIYFYEGSPGSPNVGLWSPLADDGDALRLAVRLNFLIHYRPEFESAMTQWSLDKSYDADPTPPPAEPSSALPPLSEDTPHD